MLVFEMMKPVMVPYSPIDTGFRLVVAVDEVVTPLVDKTEHREQRQKRQTHPEWRKCKERNSNRRWQPPEQGLPRDEDQRHVTGIDMMLAMLASQKRINQQSAYAAGPPVQDEYVDDPFQE